MIEKLLEPFSFSFAQLQDISTFIKSLEKNGIPIIKFIEFIENKKIEITKSNKLNKETWNKNALKCPECEMTMNLYPVNTSKRDQVGDNLRSMWVCPKCWYDEFSERTIKDWLIEINKNPFV